jgi:hypothetical protein
LEPWEALPGVGCAPGRPLCRRELVCSSWRVWCSGGGVPTMCSDFVFRSERAGAVVEKFWPGIAPIWCGVWLTEQLESHRTVNACSALCLNAVGQVGLCLVDRLGTAGGKGSGWMWLLPEACVGSAWLRFFLGF